MLAELEQLRPLRGQNAELNLQVERLRSDLQTITERLRLITQQLELVRKDSEELVRVRHEVEQLRQDLPLLQERNRHLVESLRQTTLDRDQQGIARQTAEALVQRHEHRIQLLEQELRELREAAQRDQATILELRRNTDDLRLARAAQERSLARITQLEQALDAETQARLQAVDRVRILDAQLRDAVRNVKRDLEAQIAALRIQVRYWRHKARQNQQQADEMQPQINLAQQLSMWLSQLSQTVPPARTGIAQVEEVDDSKDEEDNHPSVIVGPPQDLPRPIMPLFTSREERDSPGGSARHQPPRPPARGPGSSPSPSPQSSGPSDDPLNLFPESTNGPAGFPHGSPQVIHPFISNPGLWEQLTGNRSASARPHQRPFPGFPAGTFGQRPPTQLFQRPRLAGPLPNLRTPRPGPTASALLRAANAVFRRL